MLPFPEQNICACVKMIDGFPLQESMDKGIRLKLFNSILETDRLGILHFVLRTQSKKTNGEKNIPGPVILRP